MAQLVEQLTRNEQVAGSSPATSSKKTPHSNECGVFAYGVINDVLSFRRAFSSRGDPCGAGGAPWRSWACPDSRGTAP